MNYEALERRIDPLMPGQVPMIEGRYPLFPDFMELAFTDKQRQALRNRDENRCQFPDPHDCEGRKEIHHILPQSYAHILEFDADFPENGITLCRNAHHIIHPDMQIADQKFSQGDKEAYNKAYEVHKEKLNKREIYWNPEFDRVLSVIAIRNTQRAKKKGWSFPLNGKIQ